MRFTSTSIAGRTSAVNPAHVGTKAAALYVLHIAAGAEVVVHLRLRDEKATADPSIAQPALERSEGLPQDDSVFEERIREADEFYASRITEPLSAEERRVARQAYAGLLWSKQFYHYSVKEWLEGDPAHPAPPAARRGGRNAEWSHAYHARRHVDAGQVGVSLVRRVGPRVPHAAHGDGGSAVREGAARAHAARVVHAPERPAPRVRVRLRRRESAGARLGGLARLQDDRPARWARSRLPRPRVPEAAHQFHLVGEPQGSRRTQPVLRRLSRARQHRRVRPLQAAAHGRTSRAGRRHGVDGLLLQHDALDGARAGERGSGLRGRRLQVLRALRRHRRRDEQPRRHTDCGTSRTASTTTSCTRPTSTRRCACARSWGSCRCSRAS